jgi:hypothetical protein
VGADAQGKRLVDLSGQPLSRMEFSEGQVDALGEFVAHRGTNFIIALPS